MRSLLIWKRLLTAILAVLVMQSVLASTATKRHSFNGVRTVLEQLIAVSLRPNKLRNKASRIRAFAYTFEYMSEVVLWFPTQVSSCCVVDIDPIDFIEHLPTSLVVDV